MNHRLSLLFFAFMLALPGMTHPVAKPVPPVITTPITPHQALEGAEVIDHSDHVRTVIGGSCKNVDLCNDAVVAIQDIFLYGMDRNNILYIDFSAYQLNSQPWVIPYSYLRSEAATLLPEAQSFFARVGKEEHTLYEFSMEGHVFVVEKKSTVHDTYWRVYQGWHGLFTLGGWLGIDPWKLIHKLTWVDQGQAVTLHDLYGNGKKLGAEEIHGFLNGMMSIYMDKRGKEYAFTAFSVNPIVYAALPERVLSTEHKTNNDTE